MNGQNGDSVSILQDTFSVFTNFSLWCVKIFTEEVVVIILDISPSPSLPSFFHSCLFLSLVLSLYLKLFWKGFLLFISFSTSWLLLYKKAADVYADLVSFYFFLSAYQVYKLPGWVSMDF